MTAVCQWRVGILTNEKLKDRKASVAVPSQTTWSRGHEHFWKHYGRDIRPRLSAGERVPYRSAKRSCGANGRRSSNRRQGGNSKGGEACVANLHRGSDEGSQSRQQSERAQGTRQGIELHRRYQ